MQEVFEIFRSNADKNRAIAMSAYMRGQFQFLGIATNPRRELSKPFFDKVDKAKIDWDFVFLCWAQPEREFQYLALNYLELLRGLMAPSDMSNLRKITTDKSWWDTIDCIDGLVGNIAMRYPLVKKTILKWSVDGDLWVRRIAIDHQLLYRDKTDTELLEKVIVNNFGSKEFFINKAIGWALREYSKTNPKWVAEFINKYKSGMSPLSIREASKYI